jgi:hypothetical protein
METIRAAHNLTIELSPVSWRLVNGTQRPGQPGALIALFDVRDQRITCSPAFAKARHLPGDGGLLPQDIARVVVGWAPESQNWHLGLLLAARPENGYKMLWCGLASWPSEQNADYKAQAVQAGQALARAIDRPFHLVPAPRAPVSPLSDTQPLQATTRLDTIATLDRKIEPRTPPFEFETWTMLAVPKGYVWQRRGQWMLAAGLRVLAFGALAALFIVLGIGAQTRGLAQVNPVWLPLVGMGVGVIMGLLMLRSLGAFFSTSDVIVDATAREVRCQTRLLARVRWRVPFEQVAYLLISQTPAHSQGRKDRDGPMRTVQDVWLHLYDGHAFWPLADLEHVEGLCHDWDVTRQHQKKRGRRKLHLSHYDTPAHHAAQLLAKTLDTDLWLDIR